MIGCLVIAYATGAFDLDPRIARVWGGYHYGNEEHRLAQINLPTTIHTTMVVQDYRDRKTLRPLEDHNSNWYFDDIGYILFGQICASLFGPLTADQIVWFHNALFVLAVAAIAATAAFLTGIFPALVGFILLLLLRSAFAPAIYNSASTPSLVVPMVAAIVAIVLPLGVMLFRQDGFRWGRVTTLVFCAVSGVAAGAMMLVRYPIGVGALLTILILTLVNARSWRQSGAAALCVLIGFFGIVRVAPGALELARDVKLGWYKGLSLNYLAGPPKHKPYFTLLASIARYPNALGLVIRDSAVDELLVAKRREFPSRWRGDYHEAFDQIARDVLLDYIRTHPMEYATYLARGTIELFAVIPAITFQAGNNFAGSPWVMPAVRDVVDPRDVRLDSPEQLINVRLRYLDLLAVQWATYLFAAAILAAATSLALLAWRREREIVGLYVGLFALFGLYGASRAIIPWYGQDFAVMFWILAILAIVFFLHRSAIALRKKWL